MNPCLDINSPAEQITSEISDIVRPYFKKVDQKDNAQTQNGYHHGHLLTHQLGILVPQIPFSYFTGNSFLLSNPIIFNPTENPYSLWPPGEHYSQYQFLCYPPPVLSFPPPIYGAHCDAHAECSEMKYASLHEVSDSSHNVPDCFEDFCEYNRDSCPYCDFENYQEKLNILGCGDQSLFYLYNSTRPMCVFVSADAQCFGFRQRLGRIVKTHTYFAGVFYFPTKCCFVSITKNGIKFSCNSTVAYVTDEAGTRTCWEKFPSTVDMAHNEEIWLNRCQQSAIEEKNLEDVNERISIINGAVTFEASSQKLRQIFVKIEKTKLNSKIDDTVSGQTGYIFLCTPVGGGHIGSVHFNGQELSVRYGTQMAKMNSDGELDLQSKYVPAKYLNC